MIAGGDSNGSVNLWSADGELLTPTPIFAHRSGNTGFVFSPDSEWVVTVGAPDDASCLIDISLPNDGCVAFMEHAGGVISAAFGPHSVTFVTTGADNQARLWNTTGTLLDQLHHNGDVTDVVYSDDGASIYTVSEDGSGKRWSTRDNPVEQEFGAVGIFPQRDDRLDAEFIADGIYEITIEAGGQTVQVSQPANPPHLVIYLSWPFLIIKANTC